MSRAAFPSPAGRSERAVGLLELVVTATLVLGAILLTVGAIDGSSRAAVASENRTTALELAESELEAMRGAPIARLGFDPDALGFTKVFEGSPTVVVADPLLRPLGEETIEETTYSITRHITAATPEGAEPGSEVLKNLTVVVAWDDRDLRLDTAVAATCGTPPC